MKIEKIEWFNNVFLDWIIHLAMAVIGFVMIIAVGAALGGSACGSYSTEYFDAMPREVIRCTYYEGILFTCFKIIGGIFALLITLGVIGWKMEKICLKALPQIEITS